MKTIATKVSIHLTDENKRINLNNRLFTIILIILIQLYQNLNIKIFGKRKNIQRYNSKNINYSHGYSDGDPKLRFLRIHSDKSILHRIISRCPGSGGVLDPCFMPTLIAGERSPSPPRARKPRDRFRTASKSGDLTQTFHNSKFHPLQSLPFFLYPFENF